MSKRKVYLKNHNNGLDYLFNYGDPVAEGQIFMFQEEYFSVTIADLNYIYVEEATIKNLLDGNNQYPWTIVKRLENIIRIPKIKKCEMDIIFVNQEDVEVRKCVSWNDYAQNIIDGFPEEHYLRVFMKNDKVITADLYRRSK